MEANMELKMPSSYVDMNAKELEYDGGFNWKHALEAVAIIGIGAFVGGASIAAFTSYGNLGAAMGIAGLGMMAGGYFGSEALKKPGDSDNWFS